jgi:NAD(P)-dependent dehydrogenase (short-subunit alcohol dehydrogenase family)
MPSSSGQWTAADLPALDGRTFVITGGNSGLGLAAARALGQAGARVVLAVRDRAKGEAAAASVPGGAEVRALDLSDLGSVRAFAGAWEGDLDVLVNNAGVMATPERRTKDGFELQIGTNHLGHFALANLLLPRITDRVVTVSSFGHRGGRISLDDLNWTRRRYRRWGAYNQSKLANLLFTLELQRRLNETGSSVRATAAHPGYTATHLQGHTESRLQGGLFVILNRLFGQSADMGALPILYAATADVPGASYAGPSGFLELSGRHAQLVGRTSAASDGDTARRLWELSEQLTGVAYPAAPVPLAQ